MAIFLNQSHRLKDDPEWCRILKKVSKWGATEEEFQKIKINSVIVNYVLVLPNEVDVWYVCPNNKRKKCNIFTNILWQYKK